MSGQPDALSDTQLVCGGRNFPAAGVFKVAGIAGLGPATAGLRAEVRDQQGQQDQQADDRVVWVAKRRRVHICNSDGTTTAVLEETQIELITDDTGDARMEDGQQLGILQGQVRALATRCTDLERQLAQTQKNMKVNVDQLNRMTCAVNTLNDGVYAHAKKVGVALNNHSKIINTIVSTQTLQTQTLTRAVTRKTPPRRPILKAMEMPRVAIEPLDLDTSPADDGSQ